MKSTGRWTRVSSVAAGLVAVAMLMFTVVPGCSSQSVRYWGGKPPTQPSAMPALPAPATIPAGGGVSGGPGWLAVQLATARSGTAERPFVLAALDASGFPVEGGPAAAGMPMGAPFQRWEVDLLAELEAAHVRFPADDIAMAIDRALPGLGGAAAESLLIGVVRNQLRQPAGPTVGFWAQLIAALGATAPEPYDLMSADPSAVSLDGVQLELLMRSAVSVMAGWAHGHGAASSASRDVGPTLPARSGFPRPSDVLAASIGSECSLNESQQSALDTASTVIGGFWSKYTELLAERFPSAGGYNKFLTAAGILLAYLKLVLTFAEMKMDVRMDASPLVRTINSVPGVLRQVTAHAYYDTGNEQVLNCIRYLLVSAGLDLSVPQRGDLNSGAVYFRLVKGGGQGGIVEFKLAPGQTSLTVRTNEKGEASTGIQGQAKKPPLPADAKPVDKEAQLELVAKAKGGSAAEDAKDLAASAFLLVIDPTSILTVPADVLYRTRIFAPTLFTVPVVDHAADYRVDYTLPSGLRLTGTKCGGPAGMWELDISGAVAGLPFSGLVGVNMLWAGDPGVPPKGDAAATDHVDLSVLPGTTGGASADFKGTARLDNDTLVLNLSAVQASSSGTVTAGPITGAFGATQAGGSGTSANIPVTIGAFCPDQD